MMRETAPEKLARRYQHSLLRLRLRYGVEITIERYEEICALLAAGGGEGRRENDRGEVEAWVEVEPDVWACACFHAGEQLIRTFMPAPPPKSVDADLRAARKQITNLQQRIAKLNQLLEGHAVDGASVGEVRQLRAQAAVSRARGDDISWFKQRMQEARSLIAEERFLDAAVLLDAVSGIPKSDHPGTEPERFAAVVAERSAQVRPYWEQLFEYRRRAG